MYKNFIEDFYKFKNKILNKENFAYTRYADGEVKLMKGLSVGKNTQAFMSDKWSCENRLYKLGKDLFSTLNHVEKNYYYAITSPNQSFDDHIFLKNHINHNDDNITFSDLWINGNYTKFKSLLYQELDEPVVCCASQYGKNKNLNPVKVLEYYSVPDDCVNYYENNYESIQKDMQNLSLKYTNTLFLISAGPLSEILIHNLYTTNPNNRYIDVGSATDELIHGKKTRPYMLENTIYNKEIVLWN